MLSLQPARHAFLASILDLKLVEQVLHTTMFESFRSLRKFSIGGTNHKEASATEPQPKNSEYLPQRRQGRKGRTLQVTIINKNSISLRLKLGDFAPSRDECPTPSCVTYLQIICASRANFEL